MGVREGGGLTCSRLAQLEGHVAGIYQKLDDMSSLLLRIGTGAGNGGRLKDGTPSSVTDDLSPRTQMASKMRDGES